jgi:hypothetical protein
MEVNAQVYWAQSFLTRSESEVTDSDRPTESDRLTIEVPPALRLALEIEFIGNRDLGNITASLNS